MPNLVFVDTECLGLDIDLHAVFEVGLILRDGDVDTEYQWFLPCENLAFADHHALELTRFHDRHPQGIGKIDKKGNVSKIAEELGTTDLDTFAKAFIALTRGAHWVGIVPSFDEERLRRLVRSQGLTHAWNYQLIDSEALVGGKLGLLPPWDSNAIQLKMGLDPEKYECHTALGDCQLSRDLYDAVMG